MKFSFLWVIIVAGLMSALVACQNKDGGGVATTPQLYPGQPGLYPNCAGCGAISQGSPILRGIRASTANNTFQFSFDLLVQNGFVGQRDPKAVVFYQGAASLVGQMRVMEQMDPTYCGIPAGDYQIRPMQISQMYALTLQGGVLEAVNPQGSRVIFRIMNGTLYNNDGGGVATDSMNNRLGLNMSLEFVNGRPCGQMSTY